MKLIKCTNLPNLIKQLDSTGEIKNISNEFYKELEGKLIMVIQLMLYLKME